jgi:hypothetical protein
LGGEIILRMIVGTGVDVLPFLCERFAFITFAPSCHRFMDRFLHRV